MGGSSVHIFIIGNANHAIRSIQDWLTKPDGQPGWADYFLARGHECYIVDLPYQGRSVLGPTTPPRRLRHFSAENAAQRFTAPEEFGLWPQAALHTRWPGPGRMVPGGDATFDRFLAAGTYLINDTVFVQETARDALVALVDRIARPVVLVGHSSGGPSLWLVADARPGSVRGAVALEPLGPAFANDAPAPAGDARPYGLTNIPITYDPPVSDPTVDLKKIVRASNSTDLADCMLQAEPTRKWPNLVGLPVLVVTGQASYHARYDWGTVECLRQAGGNVEHLPLETANITGNGHFMFMETNSDAVAENVDEWLQAKKLSHSHFRTITPGS